MLASRGHVEPESKEPSILAVKSFPYKPHPTVEKESDHLEDFAPELAMVTKFGNEEPSHPWSLEVWFNGSNMFKCNYAHILYMFNGHRRSSLQSHTHIHTYIYIHMGVSINEGTPI